MGGVATTTKGYFWGVQKVRKIIGVLLKNENGHFPKTKNSIDVLSGMATTITTGFVTGRSVETKRPVMKIRKMQHAENHAHSDKKLRAGMLAKKKRPKVMECCSKLALARF